MSDQSNLLPHPGLFNYARRTFAVVGFAAVAASSAFGALWESSTWAMTADVDAELGYDSNIFGRDGADGDAYIFATPTATFQRKASVTHLAIEASARARHFFDHTEQSSVDPRLEVAYRYPVADETLTAHVADLLIESRNTVNENVGARTTQTTVYARWSGTLRDTGKSQILGRLGVDYADYGDFNSDTINYVAGLGMGWLRTELMQLYINYDFSYSDVQSSNDFFLESDRIGHGLNFGVRGELSPKLSGSASLGVGQNTYSGGYSGSDWNWFADADLTWRVHQRQSFTLSANRRNRFDAAGNPYDNTFIDISMRQGVTNFVSARIFAGWSSFNYTGGAIDEVEEDDSRRDHRYQLGAGLDYTPSSRFSARARLDYYIRDSNNERYSFNRYRVSVGANYKF